MTNDEGGTDDDSIGWPRSSIGEHHHASVDGFTASCAVPRPQVRPHDPEGDFSLFDVFNQTADADRNDETPTIDVVSRSDPETRPSAGSGDGGRG